MERRERTVVREKRVGSSSGSLEVDMMSCYRSTSVSIPEPMTIEAVSSCNRVFLIAAMKGFTYAFVNCRMARVEGVRWPF